MNFLQRLAEVIQRADDYEELYPIEAIKEVVGNNSLSEGPWPVDDEDEDLDNENFNIITLNKDEMVVIMGGDWQTSTQMLKVVLGEGKFERQIVQLVDPRLYTYLDDPAVIKILKEA